jgi:hypothetical protein
MLVHFSPSSNERCTFLFHFHYRLFFTSLFQVTGIFFPPRFYNGHKFSLLATGAKRVLANDGSQNHDRTLFKRLLKRVVKFPEADVQIVLVLRIVRAAVSTLTLNQHPRYSCWEWGHTNVRCMWCVNLRSRALGTRVSRIFMHAERIPVTEGWYHTKSIITNIASKENNMCTIWY